MKAYLVFVARNFTLSLFVAFALFVVAPVTATASTDDPAKQRLVVGRIGSDAALQMPRLKAMTTYLSKALPSGSAIQFEEKVAPSVAAMAELLKNGEVDLVSETPFAALKLSEQGQAEILLHEWKKGFADYSSLMVARKDSSIESLLDLKGKVVAFEDPGSTSGFLLPLAMLLSADISTVELNTTSETPPADAVGYVFVRGYDRVAPLVERGEVAAGAVSNLDWLDSSEFPDRYKRNVQAFYESPAILRSVVLVRAGLPASLKKQIVEAFVTMDDDPVGWEVMKRYNTVRRFEPITDKTQASLDQLLPLYRLVRDKIR